MQGYNYEEIKFVKKDDVLNMLRTSDLEKEYLEQTITKLTLQKSKYLPYQEYKNIIALWPEEDGDLTSRPEKLRLLAKEDVIDSFTLDELIVDVVNNMAVNNMSK